MYLALKNVTGERFSFVRVPLRMERSTDLYMAQLQEPLHPKTRLKGGGKVPLISWLQSLPLGEVELN
jgi:hypothetical protein